MLFRIQPSLSLCLRRVPLFINRIYASSTAPRRDDEKKAKDNRDDDDNANDDQEDVSIASMIGPYISSKQIAFHTGQFDSEHIQKKNKQAFLVGLSSELLIVLFRLLRMWSKRTRFNFPIVVVMSNSFEQHFDE